MSREISQEIYSGRKGFLSSLYRVFSPVYSLFIKPSIKSLVSRDKDTEDRGQIPSSKLNPDEERIFEQARRINPRTGLPRNFYD